MTSFRPTIRSQADLESVWRTLMTPLGFTRSSVWMMLIDSDDRPVPQLTEIDDADDPPDEEFTQAFAGLLTRLREELLPEARFAFLRSRPGAGGVSADDRAWAGALYAAGRLAGVPVEVVHRAHDHDLVPIPMDEALATPA